MSSATLWASFQCNRHPIPLFSVFMYSPQIPRSIVVAKVTTQPACCTFLRTDCIPSSCPNAWGHLDLGDGESRGGVAVRLSNLFRLDNFMSASHLGFVGQSRTAQCWWDIPCFISQMFLLLLYVPQAPPTC